MGWIILWRGDSGSDDAASDDGDVCPRLAGCSGAAAVVELPGCSPRLENSATGLRFSGDASGLWPVGRYLELLLGELPRLLDNPQGFMGPQTVKILLPMSISHAMLARRGNACVQIRY